MSHKEDLELVELLEDMSPEELAELSDKEMDALLEAKMRVSAAENPDDETLQRFAHEGDGGGGDEPLDDQPPTFGDPVEFDRIPDDASYEDGFEVAPGEDAGLSDTPGADSGYNPAVSESVGQSSPVDFDSFDEGAESNYTDGNDGQFDDGGFDEGAQFNDGAQFDDRDEPVEEASFRPARPQHPDDNFDERSLEEELSHPEEEKDPFSDKVDIEDDSDKKSIKERIAELPLPAKIAGPAILIAALIGFLLLSGGQENTAEPVGNGGTHDENTGGAAVPADGVASMPGEDEEAQPVLLTDYIDTTSAKCKDDAGSKNLGPSKAFSSVDTDAWVCYRSMGIDGAVMNIVFREPVTLTEIRLTPGFNYVQQQSGEDKWVQHRVITRILWRAGGGEFTQDIDPQRGEVAYVFDKPVTTESMSLTIQKSEVPDGAEEEGGSNAAIFEDGESVGDNGKQPETTVGKLQDATAVQKLQLYGYPGKDGGDGSSGSADKKPARKESDADTAGAGSGDSADGAGVSTGSGAGAGDGVNVAPEAS